MPGCSINDAAARTAVGRLQASANRPKVANDGILIGLERQGKSREIREKIGVFLAKRPKNTLMQIHGF
jgi:hypothetical protein